MKKKEEIQGDRDNQVLHYLVDVLEALKVHKPNDRSQRDRYYQISITDLEKIIAFFSHFVVKVGDFQDPLDGQTAVMVSVVDEEGIVSEALWNSLAIKEKKEGEENLDKETEDDLKQRLSSILGVE